MEDMEETIWTEQICEKYVGNSTRICSRQVSICQYHKFTSPSSKLPPFLNSKIGNVFQLNDGKASGNDAINIELVKNSGHQL